MPLRGNNRPVVYPHGRQFWKKALSESRPGHPKPNSLYSSIVHECILSCVGIKCDLICKNTHLRIFSFFHFCVICALSFVIL